MALLMYQGGTYGPFQISRRIALATLVSWWSGSMLLGIMVAIFCFAVLSPMPKRREGGGSLFNLFLCLVGLYWLFGGDEE